MINFRFHLVSLVAIFLALALGVVIGAGVIDRGVVDALDSRLNQVEANSQRIESENGDLRSQLDELDGASQALARQAVDGALTNVDVGVLAVRGVDDDRVSLTLATLRDAGANVTGVLWLEEPWVLEDADQVAALATAIDSGVRRPAALREQAWQQIGARLAEPAPFDVQEADDVLVALDDAGFVSFDAVQSDATLAAFPGPAAAIVLVVGTTGVVPASDIVMPAASGIAGAELPLVGADVYDGDVPDAGERGSAFADLRASELSTVVSTVDDLERPWGPPTVALAVSDLLRVPPVVGHYGLGDDRVLLPERLVS
jgi:hypothetical protein